MHSHFFGCLRSLVDTRSTGFPVFFSFAVVSGTCCHGCWLDAFPECLSFSHLCSMVSVLKPLCRQLNDQLAMSQWFSRRLQSAKLSFSEWFFACCGMVSTFSHCFQLCLDFQFFLGVESWGSQTECFEPSLSCPRMCTVSAYFQASTLPRTSFLLHSFCSGSAASRQFIPVIATMSSNCRNKWLKLVTSTNATRIKIKLEQAWIRVNC